MAEPLVLLQQQPSDWLIGLDARRLGDRTLERLQEIQRYQSVSGSASSPVPTVLIAEPDPLEFLASFIAASTAHCPIFLGHPTWTESEWQQVFHLIQPEAPPVCNTPGTYLLNSAASPGWIMIPTGGTSGKIRFAIHTWETLSDSVWGVQTYFEVDSINSCCVLPLYHVSGLMQMMRSLLTGGKLAIVPPKNQDSQDRNQSLEQILGEINPSDFFLSLVPTQLQRFLQSPPMIVQLAQLQTILLGGAPAWPELLTQSRYANLHLAPTYGMTETASQVVTLKPSDFLQRRTGCGQVLPHAKILILEANEDGVGAIAIQSKSLALGYYPDLFTETRFITDDLGYFDEQGYLHIVGRNSQKIITGGENVFPSEVESAILASGYVKDVSVVGIPDSQWGEVVAAVYVAIAPNLPRFSPTDSNLEIPPFQAEIQAAIQTTLSRYKQPKIWRCVDSIPRNAQGKINQITIRQLLGF